MSELDLGFKLMVYGISGVFAVLVLFYSIIVGLTKLFPHKEA